MFHIVRKETPSQSDVLEDEGGHHLINGICTLLVDAPRRFAALHRLEEKKTQGWQRSSSIRVSMISRCNGFTLSSCKNSSQSSITKKSGWKFSLSKSSFADPLKIVPSNESLFDKESEVKYIKARTVHFAKDLQLSDFIPGCSLHSCQQYAGAEKYMSLGLAILQLAFKGYSDIFGITHLDENSLLSSSKEVELLVLKSARRYLLRDGRAKSDFPSRAIFVTANASLTHLLKVFWFFVRLRRLQLQQPLSNFSS